MDIFTAKELALKAYESTVSKTVAAGQRRYIAIDEDGRSVVSSEESLAKTCELLRKQGRQIFLFRGQVINRWPEIELVSQ